LAKIIKLFGHREQRVDTHTDDIDGWAPPEQADGPLLSPAEAQKIACDGSSPAAALIRALTTVLTIEPEYIGSWIPVCNRLPDLLEHRDGNVHSLAKQAIIQFAETLAQQRPDALVAWRLKIENLLSLDRRSNRFVNSYPRALATLECLCAVGKWKIQDDDNELVRFCLFLELESHVSTGKFELSDIAGDFIDFCGLSYFRDFYPEANDYMLELLKGDCLPTGFRKSSLLLSSAEIWGVLIGLHETYTRIILQTIVLTRVHCLNCWGVPLCRAMSVRMHWWLSSVLAKIFFCREIIWVN
jgi:hypothetical protein